MTSSGAPQIEPSTDKSTALRLRNVAFVRRKNMNTERDFWGRTVCENFLYGNNTNADLKDFHADIVASLTKDGTLPDYFADLFTVTRVDPAKGNPDGSPRFMINAA